MAECQIWDTAGQERFSPISKEYYRGAHGCAIVYDITDRSSFDGLRGVKFWMNELEQILRFSETSKKFPIVLVGNKSDLDHRRAVETDEGIEMAKKFKIAFFETSAKGNEHVADAFDEIVTQIVDDLNKDKRMKSSRGSSEVDEDDSSSHGDSKFEKIDLYKTVVVQVEKKRNCCYS
jgi:Ras-related protein Rab-21